MAEKHKHGKHFTFNSNHIKKKKKKKMLVNKDHASAMFKTLFTGFGILCCWGESKKEKQRLNKKSSFHSANSHSK